MKNRFFAGLTVLGLTGLLLTSCSTLPQVELDAAQAAFENAVTSGAESYVPESYLALEDSLNGVMEMIEIQKSKLIKNYAGVKEGLEGVTLFANEVTQMAEVREEELKEEIASTIAEVKSLIETNRQLILEAPKGKEGNSALVAIKGELDAIEIAISETAVLFENGEYQASYNKAVVAKEKNLAINTELSDVISKYKGKTKARS